MKKVFVSGGWYAAARPSGDYAALITNERIETKRGSVPLPPGGNLIWLDLHPDGVQIAGIGGSDDRAWRWNGTSWVNEGPAWGPRSVIFDSRGGLHVIPSPTAAITAGTGSQGWIQESDAGRLVATDTQYADKTNKLYEFISRGGITIGQGGDGKDGQDPLVAKLPDGSFRLLQSGTCRAIRFYRSGDSLAIAWTQAGKNTAGLLWLTVQELQALPVYDRTVPPAPVPTPTPSPTPVPSRPNHKDIVSKWCSAAAAALPVGPDRGFFILNKVCQELSAEGYGLLIKTSGNNYKGYSVDKIIQKDGTGVDILTGPNNDEPAWSEIVPVSPSAWHAPVDVDGGQIPQPDPNPSPNPQPGPVFDPTDILNKIAALANRVSLLEAGAGHDPNAEYLAKLRADLDALPARLRVKGSTSKDYFHAHEVDLGVELK